MFSEKAGKEMEVKRGVRREGGEGGAEECKAGGCGSDAAAADGTGGHAQPMEQYTQPPLQLQDHQQRRGGPAIPGASLPPAVLSLVVLQWGVYRKFCTFKCCGVSAPAGARLQPFPLSALGVDIKCDSSFLLSSARAAGQM